jgi:hypothetical protein
MEPITLVVLAVIAIASAASTITWRAINSWITLNKVPEGAATIIKEKLQSGNYKVVSGIFTTEGVLKAQRVWEASRMDEELTGEFEKSGGVIVVKF